MEQSTMTLRNTEGPGVMEENKLLTGHRDVVNQIEKSVGNAQIADEVVRFHGKLVTALRS